MENRKERRSSSHFVYRGTLPAGLALLLAAPLALFAVSVAAMAVAAGSALALVLPVFLRHRLPRTRRDADCIVLDRNQYSRVDDDRPQLPRRRG